MSDLICVFDTETTGLPKFKEPSEHPDQPHIVDICALLYTPDGVLVDSFEAMRRQIISPLCIALAGLIAMHAVIGDDDPMRRDRRAPGRRTESVRIVRKAESTEYHV